MSETDVALIVLIGLLSVIGWSVYKSRKKKLPRREDLADASNELIREANARDDFHDLDREYYKQRVLGREDYFHGLIKLTDMNHTLADLQLVINKLAEDTDELHKIFESTESRFEAVNDIIVKAYENGA